ncbi:MAG: diacylglycerol kinase family protein [Candidatus Omnitrophota bacterium]
MYRRTLFQSFKLALEGIRFMVRSEQNMRIHLFFAVFAVVLSLLLKISPLEFIFIIFAIVLVLITETANTAFELLLDFVHGDKYHPDVKLLKDIAAGGVFIAAVNAFIIGVVVFGPRLLGMAGLQLICKRGEM